MGLTMLGPFLCFKYLGIPMKFSFKKIGNKIPVYFVCVCRVSVITSNYKLLGGQLEIRFRVDLRKHVTCVCLGLNIEKISFYTILR